MQKGLLYYSVNKYTEAIKEYEKSIQIDPNYVQSYKGLISIYGILEQDIEALDLLNPDYILYRNRGWILCKLNRYEEAIKDCTKSIKLNHINSISYYIRGLIYLELKLYKKAIEDFDNAIKFITNEQLKTKQNAIKYKQKAYEALAEMEGK